jgi:hypothetical protein
MKSKIQIINNDEDFVTEDEYFEEMKIKDAEMKKDQDLLEPKFLYLNKMTNKKHFRAFVYSNTGQRLANTHKEFEELLNSGKWFATKEEIITAPMKVKAKKVKVKLEELPPAEEDNAEVIEYGGVR